jgi:hypothetical protein
MPGAYPPLSVEIPQGPTKIPPVMVLTNWLKFIPQFIWAWILSIAAFLAAIVCWFSIVFTGQASQSLMDFIAGVIRYQWRVVTGLYVWAEPYPPFTPIPQGFADPGGYPADLQVAPLTGERNRVTVLFRIIMCIPQFIVLYFLNIANGVVLLISWFIALFTGEWNPSMKNFAVSVYRWQFRVMSYYLLLNDEYPPFSLEP